MYVHVGDYFWLTTGKTFRPKEFPNASSFISNSAREMVVGGYLSLGTSILTENQGEMGRGHLSLGTIILGVDRGREVVIFCLGTIILF